MSRLALLRELERRHRTVQPSLLEAARNVVTLTRWHQEKQATVTSAMAIDVLKRAIEREENPTFALAPEPINPGVL